MLVMVLSQTYTLVKILHIVYLKWVYFIILKLYLNKVDIKRVVENVSKSKAVGYRKGPLPVASQGIIMAHMFQQYFVA